jgi:NAD(P)H-dependent FMN reductase
MSKPLIKVIVGSVRPGRFGIQPANWIMELSGEHPEAIFELVDLAEIQLPFLDEEVPPSVSNGNYAHEHTKAWGKIVDEADGFIFVTAEYNHGIPASLKNAIDFVAKEWYYKPVAFVSYGAKSGGVRSVEQLRQVTGWLRMYDLHDEVSIKNYWAQLDDKGKFQPSPEQVEDATRLLQNIVFWSEKMAPVRRELQA